MREDMEWNVIVESFNSKKIMTYNIFNHGRFRDDLEDNYKHNKNDYDAFCKQLNRDLMYYFWSKCEWEVIVSGWPNSDIEKKIDVYDQVIQNKDIFFKYTWDMCHARKNAKKVDIDFSEVE